MQAELDTAATTLDQRPALQLTQTEASVAPATDDHMPAAHWLHVDDCDKAHVPATQDLHVWEPPVAYVPASHAVQVCAELAFSAVEYVPPSQGRQVAEADAPRALEYVPATQDTQNVLSIAPMLDDQVPFAQVLQLLEPAMLVYVPALHDRHASDEPAPTVVENRPAPQFWHTVDVLARVTVEYVPALQSVHVPDPDGAKLPALHLVQVALAVAPTVVE